MSQRLLEGLKELRWVFHGSPVLSWGIYDLLSLEKRQGLGAGALELPIPSSRMLGKQLNLSQTGLLNMLHRLHTAQL